MQIYAIHPACAIRKDPLLVPECGGLYGFIVNDPRRLEPALDRAGLVMDVIGLGGAPMLYIGASSYSLRARIKCHLRNDTQASTLRMSLGALLCDELNLQVAPIAYRSVFGFLPESEERLTRWMCEHLKVAVRSSARPIDVERRAIRSRRPTLNIAGRRVGDTPWQLLMLRRRCVELSQTNGVSA